MKCLCKHKQQNFHILNHKFSVT